jgi:signal transduction histidine kinase
MDEACASVTESDSVESLLQQEVGKRRVSQTNLFEQSPSPIMQLDLSKLAAGQPESDSPFDHVRVTATNRAAADYLGLEDDHDHEAFESGRIGLSPVAWDALFDMVRSRETSAEVEFKGSRSDGERYEAILLAAVPSPFSIPDYARVVASVVDITAHRAEERRMHELVESKTRLLASVTTELRSPLAKVIDFARLLEDSTDEPERRRDLAHAIAGGAARVASIVEDLLVASRAELGDLTLAEVPVNLSAQVAQVLEVGGTEMSAVSTPGRNVEPRICLGDPARVRQIVRNLVIDSIEHDGEDVSISIHRRASTMRLTVSSTGPPLPVALSERVFERLQEGSGAPIDPDARLIGISVARQLALAMGGDLRYRYQDGQTEFEVTLRAARSD